jgi:hypothetical protein
MSKKTFKIGEYAIGGIITAETSENRIDINALDWNTKEVQRSGTFFLSELNSDFRVMEYLEELTSFYYAEKVMKWIKEHSDLK